MSPARVYDWIIRGGRLVDGTGSPWYRADLAIQDGRIAAIGRLSGAHARQELEAHDQVVCPGFIDVHAHADLWLLGTPTAEPKLRQGVTTEILGQDGLSSVPASPGTQAIVDDLWGGINGHLPRDFDCRSVADFLARLDGRAAVNTAMLVPHTTVRIEVMGLAGRAATPGEIAAMTAIVEQAMSEGAIGLSTGLTYWPETFAETAELIAVCAPVKKWGGLYVSHLRNYRDRIVPAIEEAAAIGREAGIPVQISHLNHRGEVVLPPIEAARASGVDVTFDLYPYLTGNTFLMQFLPAWINQDSIPRTLQLLQGDAVHRRLVEDLSRGSFAWETVTLCSAGSAAFERFEGRQIPSIAAELKRDLPEVIIDLLVSSRLSATVLVFNTHRGEDDIRAMIRHPLHMFLTDSIFIGGHPHPRGYGTFPRVLGRYVREQRVLPLEEAIRKMTGLPAWRFGFRDRGLLRSGMAADLVVLDPDTVIDTATYETPRQPPQGIRCVWVNGVLALDESGPTGATPGRALKPLLEQHA